MTSWASSTTSPAMCIRLRAAQSRPTCRSSTRRAFTWPSIYRRRRTGLIGGKPCPFVPGGFESIDENLAERAAALVRAAPDAIISGPAPPLRALQAVTRTIPLIGMSEDMVGEGLVASLAHPGGNITGISLLSPELDGKRQEILIEAVPGARRIAAMADARSTPPYHLEALQHAARSRGIELLVFGVNGPDEIAAAIDAAKTAGAWG